ncbi:MAG: hypothetical protein KFKLKKLM_02443 [Flavobacteriales bacterium]|nr:hypothetical protein [Flavobacteriales bacterium]
MKQLFLLILLIVLYSCGNSQENNASDEAIEGFKKYFEENNLSIPNSEVTQEQQEKAEKNVKAYYSSLKKYLLVNVGELYVQEDSKELRELCKTDKKIEYSIQHSYYLSVDKKEEFVQFDKDLNILGVISMKDMGDFVGKQVDEAIDFEKLLEE